jgi:predicted nucleic acid-binding protein
VKIEDIFHGNPKDIPDALIGATLSKADILVTDDKRFRARAETTVHGSVWSFEMFSEYIDATIRPPRYP